MTRPPQGEDNAAGGGDTTADGAHASRAVPPPLNYNGKGGGYFVFVHLAAAAEIQELLIKVIRIENACLGDGENQAEETDEFIGLKKEMYGILFSTKNLIREKYEIQSQKGNTVDAIQKSSQINKNLETLNVRFVSLKEVFKRQTKKANKGISVDELDVRFKEMQVIKRQMEDCQNLVKRGTEFSETEIITLTDFVKQMEAADIAPPAQFDAGSGGRWREPTAEEQSTIARWGARDKDFDRQIWEVGGVVDRLNVIAGEIGNKAEQQGKMALELSRQADEANAEVMMVNAKLKALISSGNGLNFCAKLLLTLILIVMIGFIAQNITSRIKRSMGMSLASATAGSVTTFSAIDKDRIVDLAMSGIVQGTGISWSRFSKSGIMAFDQWSSSSSPTPNPGPLMADAPATAE